MISKSDKSKYRNEKRKNGASRELNPGPPVPKTGIIPLDYSPKHTKSKFYRQFKVFDRKSDPHQILNEKFLDDGKQNPLHSISLFLTNRISCFLNGTNC